MNNLNGMPINSNSNNMKDQLMTMFMFKSATSPENSSIGSMMYVFIISMLIDNFIKYLPLFIEIVKNKYVKKIDIPMVTSVDDKNKINSITLSINPNDPNNTVGISLLDYVTNFTDTKHIKYINNKYLLNQKDEIILNKHISVTMEENNITQQDSDKDSKQEIRQVIKVYSKTYNSKQIRDFISKIQKEYVINAQNKLGDRRYYFNMWSDKMNNRSRGIQFVNNFLFTMKPFTTNRKFNNLFGEEMELIKKRVKFFIDNKDWYDEKGVPYTLGLLLHGEPGTGKTSCIKCLANETDRHIININLNNPITKHQLENLFFDEYLHIFNPNTGTNEKYNIPLDKRIYVFEDIDCQSDLVKDRSLNIDEERSLNIDEGRSLNINEGRSLNIDEERFKINKQISMNKEQTFEKEPSIHVNSKKDVKSLQSATSLLNSIGGVNTFKSTSNNLKPIATNINEEEDKENLIDMSFLLNLLDGVLETPGRIIIMTTNHPELLDRAMIRPGRIDIISKFTYCSHNTIIEMIEFFYNETLTDEQKNKIYMSERKITPAEMGKLMFENFGEPDTVIEKLFSDK